MSNRISRRAFCEASGAAALSAWASGLPGAVRVADQPGYVVGEPTAEKVGAKVLADGGNAADAIVAAALAATVVVPYQTGIGGYGAHGMFAFDGGKRIVAIDANSAAPAAITADLFKPNDKGEVPGRINDVGWLAAGVPGILAGLQLVVDRFGTRPLGELLQPAISLARDGFACSAEVAGAIRTNAAALRRDPGSSALFFRDGEPIAAGARLTNPDLASLLETLAKANSVEAFYRGDVAQRIAEAFAKHGGLVTVQDLAGYRARPVEPLTLKLGEYTISTSPLTAGGLSALQALAALQAMDWSGMPAGLPRTHAEIEALRLAWQDRLTLLGDPDFANVPVEKLLSADYARESAQRIQAAVKSGTYLTHTVTPHAQGGTISLSAGDRDGNLAALTLTHGNHFGARVTVEGLGLTLGHGMSRFDPNPAHPNAPGPGKRPLNNMTPVIVAHDGRPILAAGGRGGRKIPNAIFGLLTQFVMLRRSLAEAIAAPRMHTEGSPAAALEQHWPGDETAALRKLGYKITSGTSARLSAVAIEEGKLNAAMR
jgi:gamma-glutamyltranspeptidase/glutathione hydrolase